MRLRKLSSIGAIALSSATLMAQGQRENPPQFRAGVELIQLDVAVLDGKRQPVSGLTETDFTVLDDGKPTPIRAFTPVQLATRTRASEAVWANEVAPDVVTNQIGEQDGRLVIILMDRTIPIENATVTARKIATAAVESLGPNDLAAVVSTANGAMQNDTVQNLTADRARLLRAINAADPSVGISPVAESLPTRGPLDPLTHGGCLCGVCVHETIGRVADAVRNLPRRRKVMFFIGSDLIWQATGSVAGAGLNTGCELPLRDARTAMLVAVDRANLTIHAIDPAGLLNRGEHANAGIGGGEEANGEARYGPNKRLGQQRKLTMDTLSKRESLALLPDRTGGRTVVGMNNPELAVPAIFHESDAYYVLGIERAASTRPDGGRSIEVKVGRKGLRVFSQRQYGAPVPPTDALNRLLPSVDLPVSLAVTPFASLDSPKPIVRVNVDTGAFARTDGSPTPLEISLLVVDRTGKGVASAKQTSTVSAGRSESGARREVSVLSQVEVEPGDYGVRVAVTDPATGKVASVFADTTVPKFDVAPLSLSGVSVEMASGTSSGPKPTTARAFARGDQVRAVMQIYQGTQRSDAIVPVSMRVQILDAKGAAIRDQSLPFAEASFTNRRADCVITLPLAQLPAGDYLLKLDVSSKSNMSGRAIRFSVQ
jgi:VWFA-related protein